jgi:hypothetical protein
VALLNCNLTRRGSMGMSKTTSCTAAKGIAVAGLAGFGLFAALVTGPTFGPVAAVFPPWWNASRALDAAAQGGLVLRIGIANVIFVLPDPANGRSQLWHAGAWLLLNPRVLVGCVAKK